MLLLLTHNQRNAGVYRTTSAGRALLPSAVATQKSLQKNRQRAIKRRRKCKRLSKMKQMIEPGGLRLLKAHGMLMMEHK